MPVEEIQNVVPKEFQVNRVIDETALPVIRKKSNDNSKIESNAHMYTGGREQGENLTH